MNNEDIKILEEFIKYFEAEAISRKYRRNISITVGEDDIEAIENLIKRNKELELENKTLKAHKNGCPVLPTTGVECEFKKDLEKLQEGDDK